MKPTTCSVTGLPMGMSVEDVAWVFQISPRRVRQIEEVAIRKMREMVQRDPKLQRELELEIHD